MTTQLKYGNIAQLSTYNYKVGTGSRQIHGEIGWHRRKEGVLTVGRMEDRAADGAARMAKQLNTGTLESHPPTIIMVGSGNRLQIRSGAGNERRMETGKEGVTIVGRRADREADGAAGGPNN
jgi:hypothetical protein